MSQAGSVNSTVINPSIPTEFDADVGVAIPAGNILNVIGGSDITVTGSGNTLVITNTGAGGSGITTLVGDSGNATGATVNILGSGNVITSGLVDTITIGLTGITNHSVLVGGASNTITSLGAGTNGQVLIGSTGADPVFGTLTSTGGTILFTAGAGTLNLEASASLPTSFTTDSGVAVPALNNLNTLGSGSITTSGSGSTVTTQLTGLTNHAVLVGAGTSTITKVGPTATAGQILQSAGAAADPAFSTATYPSTTTINQLLYSSSNNVVTGLATANKSVITTNATGVPVATPLALDGQIIIGSTAGAPAAATLTAGAGISITNAGNSITITGTATTPLSFPTDSGTAVPALNALTMAGSGSITTSGSGATVTTQLTGLTNHAVLVGAGTSTITKLALGTNGQVLIGSTGLDPAFGTLTSSDSSISFTTGAGSLSLQVAGGTTVGKTITGDSGGALSPTAGNWNILGTYASSGTSPVTTTGSGSTLTVKVQKAQALAAADTTKVGLANFDSASFGVDSNGFVTLNSGVSSGTYTPVITGGTTTGTGTYTKQQGTWLKVGPTVFVTVNISWTAHTGTGVQRCSMPFTAANEPPLYNENLGDNPNFSTGTHNTVILALDSGTNYVQTYTPGSSSQITIQNAHRGYVFQFFYRYQ